MAGGEQPTGAEDGAQTDERQIGERKLLLEFAWVVMVLPFCY
ncbi:hypothetical protein [Serratia marcescens]|nr:hypothetical protein [Serratia marcescens]